MRVFRCGPPVLFDASLDDAVRYGEHAVNKISEAFVFDVTLRVPARRFRVTRQNSLLESESRRRASQKSILGAVDIPKVVSENSRYSHDRL
jgi:hypothetical protein